MGTGPMITMYHEAPALGVERQKPGIKCGSKQLMLKFRHAGVLKHKTWVTRSAAANIEPFQVPVR